MPSVCDAAESQHDLPVKRLKSGRENFQWSTPSVRDAAESQHDWPVERLHWQTAPVVNRSQTCDSGDVTMSRLGWSVDSTVGCSLKMPSMGYVDPILDQQAGYGFAGAGDFVFFSARGRTLIR